MKNEELRMLEFDIQLFAEADNADVDDIDDDTDDTSADVDLEDDVDTDSDNADGDDDRSNEEPIDKTKAFSNRLSQKTKEIEEKYSKQFQDKLDNMAKVRGFDSWDAFEKANHRDTLIEAGVEDPDKFQDTLQKMISENPEVLKARQIIEEQEAREKELAVEKEIELINKLNPKIKSLDDISMEDNCQEVIDKLNKGYSLYDAYVLSNLDKINANNLEKGKRKAMDNVNSKKHLGKTRGGSADFTEVPKDVYETYRRNLPKWSDKQIREHYAKTMNGGN